METKNLILVGGGGHCKSVIDVAESAGYTILGILDTPDHVGHKVLDYTVIGTDDEIASYVGKAYFVVTVGYIKDVSLRIKLHQKIFLAGGCLATLIASTAYVSRYAIVGEGSVIMHKAVVNSDAKIGKGCIVNTLANIEHDVIIEDYCHISTGAMINGNCIVEREVFIGSQAVLVNGITIAEGSVIAAGAMVRKTIKQKGVYSDNPAVLKIKR